MDGVYNIKVMDRAMKRAQAREWIHGKLNDFRDWYRQNRETILFLGPIVITGTTTLIRVVGKNVNLRKEKDLKTLYCYDRSLGHYWALRRQLTNREWIEIDRRKKNGERLADILSELKVLK